MFLLGATVGALGWATRRLLGGILGLDASASAGSAGGATHTDNSIGDEGRRIRDERKWRPERDEVNGIIEKRGQGKGKGREREVTMPRVERGLGMEMGMGMGRSRAVILEEEEDGDWDLGE